MWSKRQLQNAMRKAGYKRLPGPGSCYRHEQTGRKVQLDDWTKENGRVWEVWARAMQTPPPLTR